MIHSDINRIYKMKCKLQHLKTHLGKPGSAFSPALSDADIRAKKMVGSRASMFSNLDYSVLYEGVETDIDEQRCIGMSASYLQGYKYSKPIPIIELKRFFSKIDE